MNNFLVSFIISVHKELPYLNEALDSVINQTYSNLEIIIIDDGSVDGSGQICDEYAGKDKRITVIHQENKGLSTVRNVGLNMMTGDAVILFDADDAVLPDYVEAMVNAMFQTKADLVVCRYTIDKTEGTLTLKGRIEPPIETGLYDRISALQALADHKINVHVWNKLYRKKLWENIRFPEGRLAQDVATTFKIFNLCKTLYVLDKPLYLHRKHSGSVTKSPSFNKNQDLAWAYSQFASFAEKNTPEIFSFEQLSRLREKTFLRGVRTM